MNGIVATVLFLTSGCGVDEADLAGKSCPCAPGWVCDTQTNVCFLPSDGGTEPDGQQVDALTTDAASTDGPSSDAASVDGPLADAALADAALADAALADAALPDAALADAALADATLADAALADATSPDATPSLPDAACTPQLVINETVFWAQTDWDDSSGGGDGIPFNNVPGTGATSNSTDEWVEIYNPGCAVDLTNYRIHFVDGTPNFYEFGVTIGHALLFSVGGSITNFQSGEYLVLGDPGVGGGSSQVTENVYVHLDDPLGTIIDEVALGTSTDGDGNAANNAPSGASTSVADEAGARVPNGADTDSDIADWFKQMATILAPN